MKLRYLVPALGVLASLNTISAETIGGLTIGGFVDVIGTVTNTSDDGEPASWGFSSEVELRVGYKIGDAVTVQVDLEFADSESYLEQAYINWAFTDTFSLTAGKFTSYAGWVAADADGLYRINRGPITALYGTDLIGVAANFAFSETVSASFFLVNSLNNGDNLDLTPVSGNGTRHLGLGADVVFTVADVGTFNIEAGYDFLPDVGAGGDDDTAEISIAANATLNFAAYQPLTLGFELNVRVASGYDAGLSYDIAGGSIDSDVDSSAVGFLAMANHTIPAGIPMSGTFMIQYLQVTRDESGVGETNPSTLEVAVALLTNPTNDPNFGVNFEVAYLTFDNDVSGVGSVDTDTITVAVEFLALIP